MNLINALHLNLIPATDIGLCYAGCAGLGILLDGCDCPPFFNL